MPDEVVLGVRSACRKNSFNAFASTAQLRDVCLLTRLKISGQLTFDHCTDRDVDRTCCIQLEENRPECDCRHECANENCVLLVLRCGTDEISGLQILRCCSA